MRVLRYVIPATLLGLLACLHAVGVHAQAPATFTLAPGGRATISYEGYCTDFGKKFPTTLQAPNALGTDAVRGAIGYIQANNLGANPQQALEAQYGVWRATGATDSPRGGDVANAVANAAQNPPANPQGTSLLDAVKNNQVALTLGNWAPVGDKVQLGNASDNFYGRGTLTVENRTQQQLTLYMPVGTLFPPATAGEQTMAAYATNIQVTNPQAEAQAAQAAATAAATTAATAAPTAQATVAATAVPTAQATAVATAAPTARPQRPSELPETSGGATQTIMLLFGFALLSAALAVRLLRRAR